jgi:hypothetical protein
MVLAFVIRRISPGGSTPLAARESSELATIMRGNKFYKNPTRGEYMSNLRNTERTRSELVAVSSLHVAH